ncbi:PsiF family protein [Siccibacter turicensis]|uniref:Phosphate starvation-inducible protein PsiF n=1 Tax=Siccibacter turicensis TaxID=357233 RepID=A0A2P8VNV5_9ENTR|nr:PsiF family protein [Siccibacter turicensis]PSN09243.1 hypothetical protein C7G83_00355 [Siccibacter turicensis]
MKMTLLTAALFGTVVAFGVHAEDKKPTPQQQRMVSCNERATADSLKGDARKTFMSNCLKKSSDDDKGLTPQQQKMRECSNQATQQSLKGQDRTKFMSGCLKKPA